MANIALLPSTASNKPNNSNVSLNVEESFEQATLFAATDLDAGTPVIINSNGDFAAADASVAGTADVYGITVRKVKAGQAVTAIARGVLSGFNFAAQSFGKDIFLSDDAGRIADGAGTVSVRIGRVIPVRGELRGQAPAKLLQVQR
jgi:hypothetical protein